MPEIDPSEARRRAGPQERKCPTCPNTIPATCDWPYCGDCYAREMAKTRSAFANVDRQALALRRQRQRRDAGGSAGGSSKQRARPEWELSPGRERIDYYKARERDKQIAARELREETSALTRKVPTVISAAELVTMTDPEVEWRISGIIPAASKVLVYAPAKTGKSIVATHMANSLVTGEGFGGRYDSTTAPGNLVYVDFELSHGQLGRRIAKIVDEDALPRFQTVNLRGEVGNFDILDEIHYPRIVELLRSLDTRSLVIDCLGPLLRFRGINENDNSEVGALLDRFDQLTKDAGVSELVMVHHAGKGSDDSGRGASVIEDWPDVIVRIAKKGAGGTDAVTPRMMFVKGRDIPPFAPVYLDVDLDTLDLRCVDRIEQRAIDQETKKLNGQSVVVRIVRDDPGIKKLDLYRAMRDAGIAGKDPVLNGIIDSAIEAGCVITKKLPGPGRAPTGHFPVDADADEGLASGAEDEIS